HRRSFGLQFRTVATLDGEQLDAVIVPVFKEGDAATAAPDDLREKAEWVARESVAGRIFSATTHLERESGTRLVVVSAGSRDDYDVQRSWQLVSAGVRALWQSTATRIAIVLETRSLDEHVAVQSGVEGVLYAMWRPEAYRTGPDERKLPPLEEVLLVVSEDDLANPEGDEAAVARGEAIGEAVNWARSLANEPANIMTPTKVADETRELAAQAGLDIEVLDEEACAALGMGSYLSVARGSDEPAQFVVLRHRGRQGDGFDLGLVGKGITFDSGGISLKDPHDMHLMKYDMSGAAAILAAAAVVGRLKLPINLIAAAPCTENLPGGHATKPGDIVTSMSGKTVEVINTDAEGRLVLIDGITYVQREGATRVVDVATLTGAVRTALGRYYTGLFGRPEGFVDAVRRAGDDAGERMWPLPLSDEYRDEMKSEIADLHNSTGRGLGGAILGAAFVDAVVDAETEWAHLDIASTAWFEEDRPFSPKGPQGPAVRTLVQLAASIAARNS
ncbi:MAG: leucyl aminopeptidase family protein, partial [Candidatus Limnocylindrales bacterium]